MNIRKVMKKQSLLGWILLILLMIINHIISLNDYLIDTVPLTEFYRGQNIDAENFRKNTKGITLYMSALDTTEVELDPEHKYKKYIVRKKIKPVTIDVWKKK